MRSSTIVAVAGLVVSLLAVPATARAEPVSGVQARKACAQVQVIGHRGVGGVHENTRRGWNLAKKGGADVVEGDIWLTRDGVPVIIHDATWDRTTNWHGRVRRTRYSVVRKRIRTHGGDRIPTLWQALRWSDRTGVKLMLELKWSPRMRVVARVLKRRNLRKSVSFYARPQEKNGKLPAIDRAKRLGLRTGVKAWYGRWPMRPRKLRRHGTYVAVAKNRAARKRYVRTMHRADLKVYPKMSTRRFWPRLVRSGADGIMVSKPARYRRWCRSR